MKKLASLFGLTCLLALTSVAQTPTTNAPGPAADLWDYMTTGTNYYVIPFTTYSMDDHSFGGGVALGYRLSEMVQPVLRLDYFNSQFWNVSLTATLQPPRFLLGKIPITPFAVAGMGTPFSGISVEAVPIVGAGAALRFDTFFPNAAWAKRIDAIADYEYWSTSEPLQRNQGRFGFVFKF